MRFLAPIVEGQGEQEAVPALLYKIANTAGFQDVLLVNPPIRIKAGTFLNNKDYFRKYVALAAAKATQKGGAVLILLDCEDDCPGTLGPRLLEDAKAVRADVDILVALAYREYESWFIAGVHSLRGLRGLPTNLEPPPVADAIRNAKGWLGERMNVAYDEITHQLEFTRKLNLQQARANLSFERFYNRIDEFLNA